jgi:translation initiation factor IF-3
MGQGQAPPPSAAKQRIRINQYVRAASIRLIDENGGQLGVMTPQEAMQFAVKAELDLVEIAPTATPPVCRIMDFSKFKYEQEKKDKEARKKQKTIQLKEIKFHPNIDEHDYGFKKKHIENFLKRGDKVKVTMVYRGREKANTESGRMLLQKLAEEISPIGLVESAPIKDRNQLIMILQPKH